MRKVQSCNVEPVLKSKYLYCKGKSNKPRISHVICESKCSRLDMCHEYGEWYFQYYGKELEKPKKKVRKTRRKKK